MVWCVVTKNINNNTLMVILRGCCVNGVILQYQNVPKNGIDYFILIVFVRSPEDLLSLAFLINIGYF